MQGLTEEEIAAAEAEEFQKMLEYVRAEEGNELVGRYGKRAPSPVEEAVDTDGSLEATMRSGDIGAAPEDEEIPGVEVDTAAATDGPGDLGEMAAGEGSDESARHQKLRALLAKMTQEG